MKCDEGIVTDIMGLWERVREALFPARLSEYKADFERENYRSLKFVLFAGIVVSGCSLLVQLVLHTTTERGNLIGFLGILVFSLAMFLSYNHEVRNNPTLALYIWVTALLFCSVILGTSFSPNTETFVFIILLLVLPLLISDAWGHIIIYVGLSATFFLVMSFITKDRAIFEKDLLHTIIVSLITIILSRRFVSDNLIKLETSNKAETKAEHDGLTGIYNRRGGEQMIREYLANGVTGSFLIMDVDDFKFVNDHYGHAMGDEVLKKVALTLSRHFRESDVVMRMGGDEFIVYAIGMADIRHVENKLISLCEDMRKIVLDEKTGTHISVSIGCAVNLGSYTDYDALSAAADKLLYRTKTEGKDGYRCSDADQKKTAAPPAEDL